MIAGLGSATAQAGTLVVSLTFDDTVDDIRNEDGSSVDSVFWQAQNTLRPLGMRATIYVNAPRLQDNSGARRSFLTTQQLRDLAAPGGGLTGRGHDIGGHSLHHLMLPNVEARSAVAEEVEQQRQICGDRQSLTTITAAGGGGATLSVWDFAYPFGAYEWNGSLSLNYYFGPPVPPVDGYETRDRVGRQSGRCGYLTGRRAGGLDVADTGDTCSGCPRYESIPPSSRWAIKTAPSVDADDTLAEIKSWVVNAKAAVDTAGIASGWLPLVFHNLCDVDDCVDDQRFGGADFAALAGWLATQSGVEVKSVHDVVDPATTTEKAITVPAPAAANSTVFNGESAIDSNRDELPDCFQRRGRSRALGVPIVRPVAGPIPVAGTRGCASIPRAAR